MFSLFELLTQNAMGMLWQEIEEPLLFLVLIMLFPVTLYFGSWFSKRKLSPT